MLLPEYGMEMVPTPGDMVGAKDPEKIKAAVAFLKFETKKENQIKGLEMAGLQPVSSEIEIPASLTEADPLMAEVLDIQSKAKWIESGVLVSECDRHLLHPASGAGI